jgi:branched-chain amino acid transport system substrate-binding protein
MQVVAQAVEATGGFEDEDLAAYTRASTFNTVMGQVTFGKNGEWTRPRVLQVQYQGVAGYEPDQFKDGSKQVVIGPSTIASGDLIYPFEAALQDWVRSMTVET